jgi:S1-C subfamily serine protease
MPLKSQPLYLCWSVGLVALLSCAVSSWCRGDDSTPSLDTLKSLHFSKAQQNRQTEEIGYSDIFEAMTAAKAYGRGLDLLPRYHEPILTRGPAGVALFRKISPSVVLVMTGDVKNDELTNIGIGTGVVIDSPGYVLTNWHVISGYEVAAIFFKPASGTDPSKQGAVAARVIAQDPTVDLALLKIIKPPEGLNIVKLGDMANVQVAEDIHIIGHPHGLFWSYSTGVISQVRNGYEWSYSDGSKHAAKVLQMQTAINPGNSGGPVLDDAGNILGLVAMSEAGQNLNYAIAVDEIKAFVYRSRSAATRGSKARSVAPAAEQFSAKTEGGLEVTKTVYKDLTSYHVRDSKGSLVELVAEASDGTSLRATKPTEFGGFSDWRITLPSGKKVVAHASGAAPETFQLD